MLIDLYMFGQELYSLYSLLSSTKIPAVHAEMYGGRPYENWFETMSASISGSAYKDYEGDLLTMRGRKWLAQRFLFARE